MPWLSLRLGHSAAFTTGFKQHDAGCRGDGYSDTEFGKVRWAQGDVFSIPASGDVTHHASKESTEHGGAAFYWVSDEPLCRYLGVTPTEKKFEPTHYTKDVSLHP